MTLRPRPWGRDEVDESGSLWRLWGWLAHGWAGLAGWAEKNPSGLLWKALFLALGDPQRL
jgi:hypothetical protein